jgi:hypothetical protein
VPNYNGSAPPICRKENIKRRSLCAKGHSYLRDLRHGRRVVKRISGQRRVMEGSPINRNRGWQQPDSSRCTWLCPLDWESGSSWMTLERYLD